MCPHANRPLRVNETTADSKVAVAKLVANQKGGGKLL